MISAVTESTQLADILIRKLDEQTKLRLAAKASRAGKSLESYAREVLAKDAAEPASLRRSNYDHLSFSELAALLFGDGSGEELATILDNLEYPPEPPLAFEPE